MNKQSDALANKKGIKGVQSRQFVRATAENAKNSTLSASARNNAKISEKGTENALNRSADNPQIRKASGELVKKLKKQKKLSKKSENIQSIKLIILMKKHTKKKQKVLQT